MSHGNHRLLFLIVILWASMQREGRRTEKVCCVCILLVCFQVLAIWGPHMLPPRLEGLHCIERGLGIMHHVERQEEDN